ncbi:ATP-binding protein [Streptomyces sp. NPDC057411]|uniref:ATP-binding protein n=1 Tax=unclassified Streptomyces TaxID=2593676 RepID=UPI00363D5373
MTVQQPGHRHRHRLPFTPDGRHERVVGRGLDFTRAVLADQLPDAAQVGVGDVLLVVAELLTNAVQHADGPTALEIRLDTPGGQEAAAVRVEVSDTSTVRPHPRTPRPDEPGGRGLRIVERTSTAWGSEAAPGGKTVWADLRLPTPVGGGHGSHGV